MTAALMSPLTTVLAYGPWGTDGPWGGHGRWGGHGAWSAHGPGAWGGPGPWGGPGAWWPILPIVWLLVVVTVFAVIARLGRRRWRHEATGSGQARLAERYAAGEIDEQEYEQRLATLKRLGSG